MRRHLPPVPSSLWRRGVSGVSESCGALTVDVTITPAPLGGSWIIRWVPPPPRRVKKNEARRKCRNVYFRSLMDHFSWLMKGERCEDAHAARLQLFVTLFSFEDLTPVWYHLNLGTKRTYNDVWTDLCCYFFSLFFLFCSRQQLLSIKTCRR